MSRDLAAWLQRDVGVNGSRIRQIYSGVDAEKFKPSRDPGALASEGALTIGTVGRLDPVKNQTALLRAFRSILDKESGRSRELRMIVVGDGPLARDLRSESSRLGLERRVTFLGMRDDVPELMRTMDVFVLPSLSEGICNTILEAMATGLPVVAGRVGGNPELVVEGSTGQLYDPSDPQGMERALTFYIDNAERRAAHGDAGRLRVLKEFSIDSMVRGYCDLYDDLLGANSR